ncbi:mechanosensitive ion channel family protein [Brevibacillus laterosporus]|uniref:Mechanosensitive ion channel family protein n=1 Tax=Brevibacillus laterosporus TaxID=1465 RepID=A0A502IEL0_BRELA|nr:mechanosensitive ion channel family protein [Brevibacillus laterosporus]QDX91884.1 mechanosensitive ion channel family protein [Brevibacillus laterosporus]RAP26233.1 hypothetical protein C2W64_02065 [Brevibacillus laterosporus]TPG70238.1 mechanosensitive ion channel family protein [Brevibacillus laterosporus]TPG83630.1 mechanosensitive ion channel family protein [Brevibacillus laterosporus]
MEEIQQDLTANLTAFQKMWTQVYGIISNPDFWVDKGFGLMGIVLIIVMARILVTIIGKSVDRIFINREKSMIQFDRRRVDTMRILVKNVSRYTIYFITLLVVLRQIGLDLQPVLVSAGVLSLAVGFGAQSLVKDVITGFFIIFEDQFAVGDMVTINGITGTVLVIGLRITKIKSWTGEVNIFPNGTINQVTNFSVQNSVAFVDVSIAYEEDLTHVEQILKEIVDKMDKEEEDIVTPPQVLGVQALGPSEVIIRVTAECKPNTHFGIMRKMRARIKQEFIHRGIEIPYPKTVMMSKDKKVINPGG